jgi:AcrR family transcriptional regulator
LKEIYGDFLEKLRQVAEGPGTDPREQLRAAMILLGRFLRDNRKIFVSMLRDFLNNEEEIFKYISKNVPPHAAVIRDLFLKCQKRKLLRPIDLSTIIPLYLGALVQPIVFAEFFEKPKVHQHFGWNVDQLLSNQAIEERIDVVLSGLSAGPAVMASTSFKERVS